MRHLHERGVWVCEACAVSPLSVCVSLSFISFFVEHAEDVESKEAKEEADDDKGRPNGVQSSIMIPLAVTVQLHGSVMLCLCNAQGDSFNFRAEEFAFHKTRNPHKALRCASIT